MERTRCVLWRRIAVKSRWKQTMRAVARHWLPRWRRGGGWNLPGIRRRSSSEDALVPRLECEIHAELSRCLQQRWVAQKSRWKFNFWKLTVRAVAPAAAAGRRLESDQENSKPVSISGHIPQHSALPKTRLRMRHRTLKHEWRWDRRGAISQQHSPDLRMSPPTGDRRIDTGDCTQSDKPAISALSRTVRHGPRLRRRDAKNESTIS